ncbi:MAG: endonuclease III [Candidatus Latescibacteria bacterium]|nr:endonuclease III [Candidatus Latescibacterota bacterium]
MRNSDIHPVVAILKEEVRQWQVPAVGVVAEQTEYDPFRVLIATVLSLRTQDKTTAGASARLFALADTPETMLTLTPTTIERAIYPVGFHKTKARTILTICRLLIDRYGGRVPDEIDELLTLPGVGRKTANLVVTLAYHKPGICVDTHVHRISNRWGYVKTKTPEETEFALRAKLPAEYWIIYNDLLVTYGQNLCKPISPHCSVCTIERYCEKAGVEKHR